MADKYVHFLEAKKNLNRAWRVLKELQKNPDESEVWMAAYRMCLIDYCKPFKRSNGISEKTLKLEVPNFPAHLQETHEYVMTARDKILAHSDLEPLNAKLIYSKFTISDLPMIVRTDVPNFPAIELMLELVEFAVKELARTEPNFLPRRRDP